MPRPTRDPSDPARDSAGPAGIAAARDSGDPPHDRPDPPAGVTSDVFAVDPPEKQFLTQRFARLQFKTCSIQGYSVAGEETVIQVPEFNVCFDIGRGPQFALTSDFLCLTHAHMDHIAGLGYYVSQRYFQDMKPGTILLPEPIVGPVDALLKAWQAVERQAAPYTLVPVRAGQTIELRRDLAVRAIPTHHGTTSLGYALLDIRHKLKPEYVGVEGQELGRMKRAGVEIQYRVEVPLVTCLGDTADGAVFENPDVRHAGILVTECTFFEDEHRRKAKAGKHLHVDQLLARLPRLYNDHVVLTHVSRRTGVRRAKRILEKRLSAEDRHRVHFLLDFSASADAGDIETFPPPQER